MTNSQKFANSTRIILKALANLALALLFILSVNLSALEYTYNFDLGYEDSNNLNQRVDGEAGQATDFGFGFNLTNSLQKEWDLDLTGRISRTNYSVDDLSDETLKDIAGNATYKSSTSNFSVTGLLNISQAPANRFQTQEVNNIRDQNVYALMPSYFFMVNSSDRINASYTLVDFNIEGLDANFQGAAGQAASSLDQNLLINYSKRLNATNAIAFNIRTGEIDFDDSIELGAVDYDRDDYFLSWSVTGQTNQMQVEFGRSKITDVLSRTQEQDYQLFSFTRQLNRTNSLTLSYSNGFNNPISNLQTGISVNQQNNNITAAQEQKQYSLGYTLNGDFLSLNINASEAEVRQSFTGNIENRQIVSVGLTYRFSRTLDSFGRSNISLNYSKTDGEFESQLTNIQNNNIENYSVAYNYVYSSNLVFSLSYQSRETTQIDITNSQSLTDSKSTFFTISYSDRGRF